MQQNAMPGLRESRRRAFGQHAILETATAQRDVLLTDFLRDRDDRFDERVVKSRRNDTAFDAACQVS